MVLAARVDSRLGRQWTVGAPVSMTVAECRPAQPASPLQVPSAFCLVTTDVLTGVSLAAHFEHFAHHPAARMLASGGAMPADAGVTSSGWALDAGLETG